MPTNYTLKPGNTLTATAGRIVATVSGDASAIIQPGFARTFGPYLAERNLTITDSATVTTAEAGIINLGGLLMANAGAPVDAVAATVNVNPTGDDNGLTFTAKTYGAAGNNISVTYNDPGAASQSLSVSVSGTSIVVSLATNGGASITSTAAQVKAAIEAVQAAANLITIAIMTSDSGVGDDGSGVVTAMAATALADGAGDGIGTALPGAICIDTTNADIYRNDGTQAAPVWVKVGDAA
ncbi:MAG: B-type flagellin [Pseudomonadota bacterium]|jgi:hypothetical protein